MESWIHPHSGSAPGAADPSRAPAFTRAFFERVRDLVFPRMTPALAVEGVEVRYFAAADLGLWAMSGADGLVLACECDDTPALLSERARRWLTCLRTRTTPGVQLRTWGLPVYGARLDAASDRFDVVWATPGPWCGFVLADDPAPTLRSLPPHWRQPELASA
jgi:hypothetical protein